MPQSVRDKGAADDNVESSTHSVYSQWKRRQDALRTKNMLSVLDECTSLRAELTHLDPTIDEETISKIQAQIEHLQAPVSRYKCPYCAEPDKAHGHLELHALVEHIQTSTALSHGETHDELERRDGWYDQCYSTGIHPQGSPGSLETRTC